MQVKVGGAYQPISHRTLATRVRHTAFGLRALGVPDGAVIAILSENRPEWAIADYACLTARYLDVPIYPTLPDEQIAYILQDSGTVAIFVSTTVQAQKIAAVRASLPALKWVIAFDDVSGNGIDLTLAALEARGAATETPDTAARYRDDAMAVAPDQVATIVYTSGTTGEPKGAMLTHGNLASNVAAVA
ncbi:MAG TPA: AMP-binding protein, partial [Gaiellaceae bacterium]|nr:AMP-binding protein [Gaiellaceae bacterium]